MNKEKYAIADTLEIKIDEHGNVLNAGIHDAEIIDLNVSGKGESAKASLVCKSEAGEIFTFNFHGLYLCNLSLFMSQNVILDVIFFQNRDAESALKEILDLETHSFYKYNELNDKIKRGEIALVRFVPSVGADVTIICNSVSLNG